MKRMFVKDIILALLPVGLLLIFTNASQSLRFAAAASTSGLGAAFLTTGFLVTPLASATC